MSNHKSSEKNQGNNISTLTEIYNNFFEKNDFLNALLMAKQLVNIRGQAQDWLSQATCQTLLGDCEEAMESFAETLSLDRENSTAWSNLGGLLNSLGEDEKALMCFIEAIELEPDNLDILTNIGTSLSNVGRHEEALEILNSVIQNDNE